MPNLPDLTTLQDDLSLFDDWTDKYAYLIDLGRKLPPLPEAYRTEAYKVHGCTSQVWLVPAWTPEAGTLSLQADSDALIVKGLLAIVLGAYNGKTREEVQAFDLTKAFQDMGLAENLTPNRRNGFTAMVTKIQEFACV